MTLISVLILGAVLGGLARLLMRGEQPLGVVATVVLGVLGALAGYFVAGLFGVEVTEGVDWIRLALSLVLSIVFIGAYLGWKGRPKSV